MTHFLCGKDTLDCVDMEEDKMYDVEMLNSTFSFQSREMG